MNERSFSFLTLLFLISIFHIAVVGGAYTQDYTGYIAMDSQENVFFPRQTIFTIRDITQWRYVIELYLHKVCQSQILRLWIMQCIKQFSQILSLLFPVPKILNFAKKCVCERESKCDFAHNKFCRKRVLTVSLIHFSFLRKASN
jgi:hypothetical protein